MDAAKRCSRVVNMRNYERRNDVMKEHVRVVGAILAGALVLTFGCSREERDSAIERTSKAARELNGSARSAADAHDVPDIVREQQKRENIRQNTTWTPENRALHPIEYCQAQLDELAKMASKLQVQAHTLSVEKASVMRKREEAASQIESYGKMLKAAKAAYRSAEASNKWPMSLNGFQLSKDRAEQKIVDAAQQIAKQKAYLEKSKNVLALLEKKSSRIAGEQRKIVGVREKTEATLSELKTKQVIDGANGIAASLSAIADTISTLGTDQSDPSLEDLALPQEGEERAKLFREIMAEE